MIDRHFDITCDSCSAFNDGDPIAIIGRTPNIPKTVHDPAKIKELTYFWLCRDCREDINGAEDFFTESYFTEDELYLCEYCKAFIPEDVREEYDDTEVCLTCSPRLEEVESE
jgi:hypothetical protein